RIEKIGPQNQFVTFQYSDALQQTEVVVPEARRAERILAKVAVAETEGKRQPVAAERNQEPSVHFGSGESAQVASQAQALCPICFNWPGVENMRLNFSECRKAEAGIHFPEFIRVLELLCELAHLKKPIKLFLYDCDLEF